MDNLLNGPLDTWLQPFWDEGNDKKRIIEIREDSIKRASYKMNLYMHVTIHITLNVRGLEVQKVDVRCVPSEDL